MFFSPDAAACLQQQNDHTGCSLDSTGSSHERLGERRSAKALGEYRSIMNLCRVLPDGLECKLAVDQAIDCCNAVGALFGRILLGPAVTCGKACLCTQQLAFQPVAACILLFEPQASTCVCTTP